MLKKIMIHFSVIALCFITLLDSYAENNSVIQLDANAKISVSGKITVGRILFLTHDEYKKFFYENKLSPLDIVVIDRLPTELDPFPLAGVITEVEVQPGCHMERQAEQIQTPFLTLKNAFSNSQLRDLSKINGLLSLEVDSGQKVLKIKTQISSEEAEKIFQSRIKPIPLSAYAKPYSVIQPMQDVPEDQLEHYGQKLENIYRASYAQSSKHYPSTIGIPADVGIELQKATKVKLEGASLRLDEAIQQVMQKNKSFDLSSPEILKNLAMIESWIDQIQYQPKIFDHLMSLIDVHFKEHGGIFSSLRFRSSNRIENEMGAGVYRSMHVPFNEVTPYDVRVQQLFKTYLEVMKSLYTPRAYILRRMFGQDETLTDIACGIHVSTDHLKATGVASIEKFNDYKILKVVSHAAQGSGTSPMADSFYEVIYLIKSPDGSTYFSENGWLNKASAIEPHLNFLKNEDLFLLLKEAEESEKSWNKNEPDLKTSMLNFEWGMTKESSLMFFDVKGSKNFLTEAYLPESQFGLTPELNERLNRLGFREFAQFVNEQPDYERYRAPDRIRVQYLFVEIDHQNVLLAFSNSISHDKAFDLLTHQFKNEQVKLISAGEVRLSVLENKLFNSIEVAAAKVSEVLIPNIIYKKFEKKDAQTLLFSFFGSPNVKINMRASLNFSKAHSMVKNLVKDLFSKHQINSPRAIQLASVADFLREEAFGASAIPKQVESFFNISNDVGQALTELGFKDFHEEVFERVQKFPFSINDVKGFYILLTVDGIPKVVNFKWGTKQDHTESINKILSAVATLPTQHEIKILQFGEFDAEMLYPNKLVSLSVNSSLVSKERFSFDMLVTFIESVRTVGIDIADAHFPSRLEGSIFSSLRSVFGKRNVEKISFKEILQTANKWGPGSCKEMLSEVQTRL